MSSGLEPGLMIHIEKEEDTPPPSAPPGSRSFERGDWTLVRNREFTMEHQR